MGAGPGCSLVEDGGVLTDEELRRVAGRLIEVPGVTAREVALGVVLADPSGELTDLQDRLTTHPPALTRAVVARLEEAHFLLGGSEKSAKRADVALVAGGPSRDRALRPRLHAKAGQLVISEKGLIKAADQLPQPRLSSACAPTRSWEVSEPTPQVQEHR